MIKFYAAAILLNKEREILLGFGSEKPNVSYHIRCSIFGEGPRIGLYIGLALLLGLSSMNYGWPVIQVRGPSCGSVRDMGI